MYLQARPIVQTRGDWQVSILSPDQHLLSFVVRWIHVSSMALILGGTIFLFVLALGDRAQPSAEHDRWLSLAARRFEWLFWLAIGVQVITGIGNLGAFGMTLPAPMTAWGIKLVVKLSFVLLLILLSLARTFLVARPVLADGAPAPLPARVARVIYAGTGLMVGWIVLLAVSLAHG
jgi:uncharacterized membrane protein